MEDAPGPATVVGPQTRPLDREQNTLDSLEPNTLDALETQAGGGGAGSSAVIVLELRGSCGGEGLTVAVRG